LPGPTGSSGSTKVILTATVGSNGAAFVTLPAAIGTDFRKPPLVACYVAPDPTANVWLYVSDGASLNTTAIFCAISFINGAWQASIHNAGIGWLAAFVAVY
jgi:hypothetical protein